MKKILLLLLLFSVTVTMAYAESFTVDGFTYSTFGDKLVYITSGPNITNVVIPKTVTYNGVTYKVREIGSRAFSRKTNVKTVDIPNSVNYIGEDAFYGCSLESLEIPVSVNKLVFKALYGCHVSKLTLHSGLENWVESWPSSVGDMTFIGYSSHTIPKTPCSGSITIGSGVTGLSSINSYSPSVVKCYAEVPPTLSSDVFSSYNGTLYVPEGCVEAYRNAPYWKNFNNINQASFEKVTLNYSQMSLMVGQSMRFTATCQRNPNASLKWCTSNVNVAEVDDNGVVTIVGTGRVVVYAAVADDPAAYAYCIVNAYEDFTLSLNKSSLTMNKGDRETLSAVLAPATTAVTPVWTTTNLAVASVDVGGNVIACGAGECDIIVSAGFRQATCHVTVNDVPAVVLNQNLAKLQTGQTLQLSNTAGSAVTWTVTDPTVASVENGLVTALKNGIVGVTASDAAGNIATCYIWCYKLGDLNEDMKVDIADMNAITNIILTE